MNINPRGFRHGIKVKKQGKLYIVLREWAPGEIKYVHFKTRSAALKFADKEEKRLNKYLNPIRIDKAKPKKQKWYAILVFNGTMLLTRVVSSFETKTRAKNYAQDLIGKLYKGREVTSVVLDGPHASMTTANNINIVVPAPV